MDPKKLNPQDAFNLQARQLGETGQYELNSEIQKDIEDGFGENTQQPSESPRKRSILLVTLTLLTCIIVAGIFSFYWFISKHSEPEVIARTPAEPGPAVIDENQAKTMIESNLRAFLEAETNEERLKYVYMPDEEKPQLDLYYMRPLHTPTPFWKMERIELTTLAQGEVWVVVYRDLKKNQHLVSFQRFADDYLLHWSAMTAFCEVPWEKFMVQRPTEPVLMRCYIRQYQGIWPVGIPPSQYHCFLIEDKAGLFSEIAIMKIGSLGYTSLKNLPLESRHPVTVNLGYRPSPANGSRQMLSIDSLKHLRWQQMSADSRLQGLERLQ